jgi:hypothetical protein
MLLLIDSTTKCWQGAKCNEIGDNIAAPVNNYTGISIKNVYCNFHGLNTNSFIRTANNSVLLNEIILDDVNITNTPPVTAYSPNCKD